MLHREQRTGNILHSHHIFILYIIPLDEKTMNKKNLYFLFSKCNCCSSWHSFQRNRNRFSIFIFSKSRTNMPFSNQTKKCEVFHTKVKCQFCSISSCNVRLICNGRNGLTASNIAMAQICLKVCNLEQTKSQNESNPIGLSASLWNSL